MVQAGAPGRPWAARRGPRRCCKGSGTSAAPTDGGSDRQQELPGLLAEEFGGLGRHPWVVPAAVPGGAAGGEAIRGYATANAANVATGGTINGAHLSLIDPGELLGERGGECAAGDAGCGGGNAARWAGTLAAIQADSNIATGNTVPATAAFLRVTDSGAVKLGRLLNIPAASNGTIFATHTVQGMTHSIRITDDAGTPYYIMCASAATNRG